MAQDLAFAQELAREAGKIITDYFRSEELGVEYKKDHSPLTVADTKINALVIKWIREHYPEDSILGEEESYLQEGAEYTWVCDPIDGTRPFMLGVPVSVFSLARTKKGEPELAVVYDPHTDNMYTAKKGEGAHLNGRRISVNSEKSLDGVTLGTTVSRREPFTYELERELGTRGAALLNFGSAVQMGMLIARGDLCAYTFPGIFAWDAATVKLLVEEAGGKVTSLAGKQQRYDQEIDGFIASNGHLHDEIVSIISSVR